MMAIIQKKNSDQHNYKVEIMGEKGEISRRRRHHHHTNNSIPLNEEKGNPKAADGKTK